MKLAIHEGHMGNMCHCTTTNIRYINTILFLPVFQLFLTYSNMDTEHNKNCAMVITLNRLD